MDYQEFMASLKEEQPPQNLKPLLTALWFDARDQWEAAHNIAQDINDPQGRWLHAYLHRKEGDISNAQYWYGLAGRKLPQSSLQEEWKSLVMTII